MDDPTTSGVTEGFGLMFYNARWYDPTLGRFAQADTIVPTQTQGTQAWDRYAYVNSNPITYFDPTGHDATSTSYTYTNATSFTSAQMNATNAINTVRGWIQLDMDAMAFVGGVGLGVLSGVATEGNPGAVVLGFSAGLGGGIKISTTILDNTMGKDTTNLSQMNEWVDGVFDEEGVTSVTVTVTNTQKTISEPPIVGTGVPITYTVQTVTICSNTGICNTWTTSSCPSDQHAIQRLLTPDEKDKDDNSNTHNAYEEHERD